MPAAVIGGIIEAGGSIGAAAIGSSASKSAAETQANSANTALGVQQAQYANAQKLLAPYVGGSALAGLNRPVTPYGMPSPYQGIGSFGNLTNYAGYGQTPAAAAAGDSSVLMEAPDGTQQHVPMAHVSHFRALGAKVV